MHDEFWAPLEPKLRPGGVVLVNDSTFPTEIAAPVTVERIRATELAEELGNPLGASMIMVGALASLTGLVGLDALVEGMRQSIPSYRTQHIESNERAIRAGFDLVTPNAVPAWETVGSAR